MKLKWEVSEDNRTYTAKTTLPGFSGGAYQIRLLSDTTPLCELSYYNPYGPHGRVVLGTYKNPSTAMAYAQADEDEQEPVK
jgi:hypothetical protein